MDDLLVGIGAALGRGLDRVDVADQVGDGDVRRRELFADKAMLDGTMTVVPRQRFGVADVRDVADAHIKAMATPAAAGKRFLVLADGPTISWLQLAQILRDRLGQLAERVPTEETPELSCPIWSSTTNGRSACSAGGRVPPRPRSWKPRKACATSDSWSGPMTPAIAGCWRAS